MPSALATDPPAASEPLTRPPEPADEPVNILLVDDRPQNLLVLESTLAGLGQNLVRAGSGDEALRQLLLKDFAVIIMDVHMPGLDGLETAALIRGREKTKHTPIIFVTAYQDADGLFRGYELGAIDYLIKPIIPAILRSKVAVLVDLDRTNRQVRRQAEQIREMERLRHERELAAARERWEMERLQEQAHLARKIQERLFPVARVPLEGFDIGGASFPAEATGGDFFDYIPLADDAVGVAIGDVSGHGFGPALLMAEIRAYLRALALTRTDLGEIVRLLNRGLYQDVCEDRFATLLLGRLDAGARTFHYVRAGHTTGYLLGADGRVKRRLESTGVPLAVLPDEDFPAADPIPLDAGDTVVLLTDGILEAVCDDGSLFGIERALAAVRANRREPARAVVAAVCHAVRDACRGQRQLDDMTAIVIKVEAVPAADQGAGAEPALDGALPPLGDESPLAAVLSS
jgi:phosphoserine phosphatase RsbU/P